LLCAGVPRFQRDGGFAGYIGSCLDITDLKRGQERALSGQKLESMGLLASGVAHDFNNLLGGILTSAELALSEHSGSIAFKEELLRIKAAAVGGAQIVRQLMIFGGKDSPAFEPVDCSLVIREMSEVLKVSISKFVTLKTEIAGNLSFVYSNPAQIRQLVLNLVINASQAIGDRKGEIRITAKMLTVDQNTPEAVGAVRPRESTCNWRLPIQAAEFQRKRRPGSSIRFSLPKPQAAAWGWP
jgi:signal transduction histidine kinase